MSQEAVYCPASHSSTRIIYDKRKNYIRIESGYCKLCNKEHFSQEFGTWSSGNVLIDINIKQSIEDIMNKMTFEISNTHSSKNEKMSPNLENGPRFSDVAIVMEAENSTTHIKDRLQKLAINNNCNSLMLLGKFNDINYCESETRKSRITMDL